MDTSRYTSHARHQHPSAASAGRRKQIRSRLSWLQRRATAALPEKSPGVRMHPRAADLEAESQVDLRRASRAFVVDVAQPQERGRQAAID